MLACEFANDAASFDLLLGCNAFRAANDVLEVVKGHSLLRGGSAFPLYMPVVGAKYAPNSACSERRRS